MTDQIFEYAKKQGWNIGFVIIILWLNNRLERIEDKYEDCIERVQLSEISNSSKEDYNYKLTQVAILPISKEDEKRYKGITV
jgi:hypothetical protein